MRPITDEYNSTSKPVEFGQRRFKVKFKREEDRKEAKGECASFDIPVESLRRNFFSIALGKEGMAAAEAEGVSAERSLEQQLSMLQEQYGATIVEDYQYELDVPDVASGSFDPLGLESHSENPSLDDVVEIIGARQAWSRTRGEWHDDEAHKLIIAVVDTGINGNRPEFPNSKRSGGWAPGGEDPWTDWQGHGSMCACIAAGTRADGGTFDGVAPDAHLMACKTYFYDSELTAIYDELSDLARNGNKIIATNSFGRKTGLPPPRPADSDFIAALDEAIDAGVMVFFSAGHNHRRAGGLSDGDEPNSIWLHKSREDVIAVATCKLDGRMWYYSSRGPGQFFGEPGMNQKPDVTAPTPQNGEVVYGDDIRSLANGWGTSGACPQAAGLAALLLSLRPYLSRRLLFEKIRRSATSLGHPVNSQGAGRIDCWRAVQEIFP